MAGARTALFLLLATLIPISSGALAEVPLEPDLWFAVDARTQLRDLTSFPPNATDETRTIEMRTFLDRSEINWQASLAQDWIVTRGDRYALEFHLEGLDRIAPVANPTTDPDAQGKIRIKAEIKWLMDPTPFALGSIDFEPRPASNEITNVTMELASNDDRALRANESFVELKIIVTGYNRPQFPLTVHYGSLEKPSHVHLPGYPIEALRAWEEAERARARCLERVLLKQPCEDPESPTEGRSDRESPSIPYLSGILLVFALITVLRAHGRPVRRP